MGARRIDTLLLLQDAARASWETAVLSESVTWLIAPAELPQQAAISNAVHQA
jgi:hypothetical protein